MVHAEVRVSDHKIGLYGVSEHRDTPRIKRLLGSKWHPADKCWTLPLTWVSAVTLRTAFGDSLTLGPVLTAWGVEERSRVDALAEARRVALDPASWADCPGDPDLRGFQRAGVAWQRLARSYILGDEMGLGKTVQTAVVLRERGPGQVLVVCPRGVQRDWRDALRRWAGIDAAIVGGTTTARRHTALLSALESADALIMTYDVMKLYTRRVAYGATPLRKCLECQPRSSGTPASTATCEVHPRELNGVEWCAVVFDEAHKLRDPRSQQTRAAKWLSQHAAQRIALTGTPLDKDPSEPWSIWHAVAPHDVPSRVKYIDRWCETSLSFFGGLEVLGLRQGAEDEFHALWDLRFLRRPVALAAPELPPVESVYRFVEMAPAQRKVYNQFRDGMVTELNGGQLVTFNLLEHGLRLGQLAKATCAFDDDGRVVMCEPSPTLDEMLEVIEELGTAPALVASASRQLLELAAARLDKAKIPYTRIVGGMHDNEVDEARDAYNSGRARVMLLSIGAAAEGLSLTRGSTVIMIDRHWQQLLNAQVIRRISGIGRGDADADHTLVVNVITEDSYDEYKLAALGSKEETLLNFTQDAELIRTLLTGGKP